MECSARESLQGKRFSARQQVIRSSECGAVQERNQDDEPKVDVQVLLDRLKACSKARNLERGRQVHLEAVKRDYESSIYVANALISMYSSCGSIAEAREVFDSLKRPNVVSWTALALGYADTGDGRTALELFTRMRSAGTAPDSVTFVAALKACTCFAVEGTTGRLKCRELGRALHILVEDESVFNCFVQNTLIDMYGRCGSMVDASQVFDTMNDPSVASWNALILGYAANGQGRIALKLFTRMITEGPAPNSITLVAAFKACTSLAARERANGRAECREWGKEMHNLAVQNEHRIHINRTVQNTLIDMYAKCGDMVRAVQVFDTIEDPDVVSWTALISGYAEDGQGLTSLELLKRMASGGSSPNSVTFVAALKACTSFRLGECRKRCKALHCLAVANGCGSEYHVRNTLIDMYAKCGCMLEAHQVFDSIEAPHLVSWTALILGYADNGQGNTALDLFTTMQSRGHVPDFVTFVAALKACISLALKGWEEAADRAKELHKLAKENGCASNPYVQSTLIDVYAKCGSMRDARQVFDSMNRPNVVCWNVLIHGYADNGQSRISVELFNRMKREGPAPDSVTLAGALKACGRLGALEVGRRIHAGIRSGELDVILVNCLVDFYGKCGSLEEARSVFDAHEKTRNLNTWTALLTAFSSCGDHESALDLFEAMRDAGLRPDGVTFLCLLTCCGHAGLAQKGKELFDEMTSPALEHYTCMVDMFGRLNKLDEAMAMLQLMSCSPDDVTWATILGACRRWKNVAIGRLAFESLLKLRDGDSSWYMLMEQIYASQGMQREQDMVVAMSRVVVLGAQRRRSQEACWTNEQGVHLFNDGFGD